MTPRRASALPRMSPSRDDLREDRRRQQVRAVRTQVTLFCDVCGHSPPGSSAGTLYHDCSQRKAGHSKRPSNREGRPGSGWRARAVIVGVVIGIPLVRPRGLRLSLITLRRNGDSAPVAAPILCSPEVSKVDVQTGAGTASIRFGSGAVTRC